MKSLVRIGAMVITLSLVGLLAGCASYSSTAGRPVRDFDVVETSTAREFTETEMAYLRAKVVEYLVQQGKTGAGDYYVKINLGTEFGVPEGEWVVVRYTRYPAASYSVASASPTYTYPAYGYSSYDYYPFGYYGYSSFGFRYYDYPYYSYYGTPGYYPPYYNPIWSGGRSHNRDRWKDRRDDKDHDGDRPRVGGARPSGALKPSFVPSNVGRTPGNGSPGTSVGEHRRPEPRWDGRSNRTGDGSGTRRWTDRGDRTTPNYRPAYTPPSTSSGNMSGPSGYRPATRSNLHRDRGDAGYSRSSGGDSGSSRVQQSQPERTYSPPARSESSSAPRYESPRYEQSNSSSSRSESSGYTKDRTDGDTGGRRKGIDP